jgi:hypothetical protein
MPIAGSAMPIAPFLEGRVFDPDLVRLMGIAFEDVRRELGLSENDPLTKVVARTVIDFAEREAPDAHALTAAVLNEFRARSVSRRRRAPTNEQAS